MPTPGRPIVHRRRAQLWATAIVSLVSLVSDVADAFPVHRRLALAFYGTAVDCRLCHDDEGGGPRNAYGKQFLREGEAAAGVAGFDRIDGKDADGDGVSNRTEILAGSNPGDARSLPGRVGRYAPAKSRVHIPRDQLASVMTDVEKIDVIEPRLTEAQREAVERATSSRLSEEALLPTFYAGMKAGRPMVLSTFAHYVLGHRGGRTKKPVHPEERLFSMLVAVNPMGHVVKVLLFSAGQEAGSRYQPYLKCLIGASKGKVPMPGEGGCPAVTGRRQEARQMGRTIDRVLWTMAILFSSD